MTVQPPPHAGAAPLADPFGPGPRPQLVGVLGGIASGKTRAAAELAGPGGVVIQADEIAQQVLASAELAPLLRAHFGAAAIGADGAPDRAAIAARAFADPALRRMLEGWIHPRVRATIAARLRDAQADRRPRVVLDVPLLLENDLEHGLARLCDRLVYVESDLAERERRAAAARGWAIGEVARREAAQLPQAEKRARADAIIDNRGALDSFLAACARVRAGLDRPAPPGAER
ncbi:MAG: dephospho-CoA kinase [Planctomycetota bacterium]|nr:MAG: dephospho-CoA kinase [Planctomycetota bacterium]